jgi:hypothetical protein
MCARPVIAAGFVFAFACASVEAQSAEPTTYEVRKADRLVLTITNRPGPLVSTALAPAGSAPIQHPFLSGSAHAADQEHTLRSLLDQSRSFDEFVARLRGAGFELRKVRRRRRPPH